MREGDDAGTNEGEDDKVSEAGTYLENPNLTHTSQLPILAHPRSIRPMTMKDGIGCCPRPGLGRDETMPRCEHIRMRVINTKVNSSILQTHQATAPKPSPRAADMSRQCLHRPPHQVPGREVARDTPLPLPIRPATTLKRWTARGIACGTAERQSGSAFGQTGCFISDTHLLQHLPLPSSQRRQRSTDGPQRRKRRTPHAYRRATTNEN